MKPSNALLATAGAGIPFGVILAWVLETIVVSDPIPAEEPVPEVT